MAVITEGVEVPVVEKIPDDPSDEPLPSNEFIYDQKKRKLNYFSGFGQILFSQLNFHLRDIQRLREVEMRRATQECLPDILAFNPKNLKKLSLYFDRDLRFGRKNKYFTSEIFQTHDSSRLPRITYPANGTRQEIEILTSGLYWAVSQEGRRIFTYRPEINREAYEKPLVQLFMLDEHKTIRRGSFLIEPSLEECFDPLLCTL